MPIRPNASSRLPAGAPSSIPLNKKQTRTAKRAHQSARPLRSDHTKRQLLLFLKEQSQKRFPRKLTHMLVLILKHEFQPVSHLNAADLVASAQVQTGG
jgi:hypothetical protein